MKINRADILTAALLRWGEREQTDMMLEEMSELAKALLKLRRDSAGEPGSSEHNLRVEHVREEIADVQIMLDQMKIIFGVVEDATGYEEQKLARLAGRLGLVMP